MFTKNRRLVWNKQFIVRTALRNCSMVLFAIFAFCLWEVSMLLSVDSGIPHPPTTLLKMNGEVRSPLDSDVRQGVADSDWSPKLQFGFAAANNVRFIQGLGEIEESDVSYEALFHVLAFIGYLILCYAVFRLVMNYSNSHSHKLEFVGYLILVVSHAAIIYFSIITRIA